MIINREIGRCQMTIVFVALLYTNKRTEPPSSFPRGHSRNLAPCLAHFGTHSFLIGCSIAQVEKYFICICFFKTRARARLLKWCVRPELRRDLGGISRRDRGTRHGAHDFIVSAYKVRARLRGVRLACVAAQRGPRLRRLRCVPFFFFFLAIFFFGDK